MDHLPLLILGIFISTLGIVNIKGNISTIHSLQPQESNGGGRSQIRPGRRHRDTGDRCLSGLIISHHILERSGHRLYRSPGNDRWSGIYPVWADQIQSRHLLTGKSAPHEVSPHEGRLIIPAPVCFRSFSRVPHTSSPADGVPYHCFPFLRRRFPHLMQAGTPPVRQPSRNTGTLF